MKLEHIVALAVRCKYTVKARQVDTGFGYQRGQLRNEVQRLEEDMCGAVSVRRLELIAHLPGFGQ